MSKDNQRQSAQMGLLKLSVITGFVAGLLGSMSGYAAHYFKFTKADPHLIMAPFRGLEWVDTWLGYAIAILLYGILSIGTALIYYIALRKRKTPWTGLLYGVGIFLLIFLVLPPILPDIRPLFENERNTLITELCIFICYGLFIGYSISYEYNEQQYFQESAGKQQ
ncbi:MAG TPA: YqhR family membrane protein [Bacillaceae bacterium]